MPIERRRSADHVNVRRGGMESEREVEGRGKRSSNENSGHVVRQPHRVGVRGVGSVEDNWNAREQVIPMAQQILEGRSHDGDDQMRLPREVFFPKILTDDFLGALVRELGKAERFAIELDAIQASRQRVAQALIEDGKTRQTSVLVEQQQYTLTAWRGHLRSGGYAV